MNTNQYDQILKKYPPKREYLIQMLHDLQHHSGRNFISTDALKEIVSYTKLSMAAVQGMVEYYSMF